MTISELVTRAHDNAVRHGFWDVKTDVATKLMLIVTELAEACEADRHGDRANFEEEIADTFIRLGDLCGGLEINIERVIGEKMRYNELRPRLHGKRY